MWLLIGKYALVAILGWGGFEISSMGKKLTEVVAIVQTGRQDRLVYQRENTEDHRRLLDKLETMIPRKEYESEILGIKTRIAAIELELSKLKERK